MSEDFRFNLLKTDGKARRGEITMPRGTVRTLAFMPVRDSRHGQGDVSRSSARGRADIILGNNYHLMLRPSRSGSRGSEACMNLRDGRTRS